MLFTLAALLVAADPVPPSAPIFKLIGTERVGERYRLTFEVTNPNADPMPYFGYTADSFQPKIPDGQICPLYQIQLRDEKEWKSHQPGWCKTGVGPVSIPAKGTVTFEAHVPADGWREVRVGLRWSENPKAKSQTAWSSAVDRKDIKAGK
ncbi:hypothetical protein GobsT_19380 [Gemmata obscuriglobus]|uniref:Uncharacterized protein n=1 Tax=Gemmata obscuriglobus TaxID=114 RepID=A0A2Z3H9N0_9BACT|nr:hypothetical protein [Gemmata obscuriglobus]AWM39705.1 hypothetical protein C1280_23695 [Gemmata obscuriglobus]QEG27184.1 hypothetical protein GobsT_19380 [Gemmata obscuriglobus]VTS03851.1 unnamed protein product [Gemmata obscuriglobus UQM 2246]